MCNVVSIYVLNLIHNIRFDRIKRDNDHSFKKSLNNYSTSDLSFSENTQPVENLILSSNWIALYRKQ